MRRTPPLVLSTAIPFARSNIITIPTNINHVDFPWVPLTSSNWGGTSEARLKSSRQASERCSEAENFNRTWGHNTGTAATINHLQIDQSSFFLVKVKLTFTWNLLWNNWHTHDLFFQVPGATSSCRVCKQKDSRFVPDEHDLGPKLFEPLADISRSSCWSASPRFWHTCNQENAHSMIIALKRFQTAWLRLMTNSTTSSAWDSPTY